jgi:hypothetical protein
MFMGMIIKHRNRVNRVNESRRGKWKTCSTQNETRYAYKLLPGKPQGKRPLEILTYRRENNNRIEFNETGSQDLNCVEV